MPKFLSSLWNTLPFRAPDDAGGAFGGATPQRGIAGDNATRADQLERINLYARAGYFDTNLSVDAFAWQGEITPD